MFLAQVNIARMRAPIDDPLMADFVNNIDRINEIAESQPGFVWRLKGDDGNALAMRVFEDDRLLINVSTWRDIDALYAFTYQTAHKEFIRRKKEWFGKLEAMHMALWYTDTAEVHPQEAKDRLLYLQEHGSSPHAFSFKEKYSPIGQRL